MEKEEIIKNIESLFSKWYNATMFDSTGRAGIQEHDNLVSYCKEHIEEFKEFAKDMLSNPAEICVPVSRLCNELLTEKKQDLTIITKEELKQFIEDEINKQISAAEFEQLLKQSEINAFKPGEYRIFSNCNYWLNYFNNTKGIDYYKDYIEYKDYLDKHYIGWNPFKEDDPNPTYKEFIANREKYQI